MLHDFGQRQRRGIARQNTRCAAPLIQLGEETLLQLHIFRRGLNHIVRPSHRLFHIAVAGNPLQHIVRLTRLRQSMGRQELQLLTDFRHRSTQGLTAHIEQRHRISAQGKGSRDSVTHSPSTQDRNLTNHPATPPKPKISLASCGVAT